MHKLLIIPLILAFTSSLFAQNTMDKSPERANHWTYNFWGGHSFRSVKFLGKTGHTETTVFSYGFRRPLNRKIKSYTVYYTAGFTPFIEYYYPKRDLNDTMTHTKGIGFYPVGFFIQKDANHLLNPFYQVTGGMMLMEDFFPTSDARKLNFTFDITAGLDVNLLKNLTLSSGYKFHHISNAQTGKENPGVDSNFLFISLSIK